MRHQMALQRLELFAVFEADNKIIRDRLLRIDSWLGFFLDRNYGFPTTANPAKGCMNIRDETVADRRPVPNCCSHKQQPIPL